MRSTLPRGRPDNQHANGPPPDNELVASQVQFAVVLAFTAVVMLLVMWER